MPQGSSAKRARRTQTKNLIQKIIVASAHAARVTNGARDSRVKNDGLPVTFHGIQRGGALPYTNPPTQLTFPILLQTEQAHELFS